MAMESSVSKAVRQGLLLGTLGAVAFVGTNTAAAEEEGADVERIAVTGSRIKQVDVETSTPVTVITAADMQLTGEATVADVLNNTSVNSFGSWRGVSGYGSGGAATSEVNMRGLGSEYTLVLLDGRRLPGTSSSAGVSADTSKIPMAIVERIEILRDGASAVYGSDAVAGVINIITKKDFEGLNFSYDYEDPKVKGGETSRFTVTTGYTSDKGNITLAYEYYTGDSIFDRDIWKLDDPTYGGYSSYSSVFNAVGDSGWVDQSELCAQADNVVLNGDGRCLYSFGEVTKFYGDVTQNSVLSNFNYELADNLQFRGRAAASLSETDTRYAGTPVSTNLPTISADNAMNPHGEDLTLYMRAANLGPRDTRTEINSIDFFGGLVGYVDVGNGLDWELNGQHSRSTTNAFNTNLINDNIMQIEIDSGEWDIFNTTGMSYAEWDAHMADLYGKAAHTGVYQAQYVSNSIDGSLSTALVESGDFTLAGLIGFDFEHLKFEQYSDPQSASGSVSGGSGGDDVNATRDRTSVFAELQAALPFAIDINAAVRWDDYSQEGDVGAKVVDGDFDNVSPQVGISWRPVESLLLRANWGQSFRAPSMGEMFSTQALSFEPVYDTYYCDVLGNPGNDTTYCSPSWQHKTWFGGNPDLKPEEGESYTAGIVWNPLDNWSLELSYYDVTLDNKIASTSVRRLINEALDNPGGVSDAVTRTADGKIDVMYSFDQNLASLETSGFDFQTNYNLETGFGEFNLKAEASYVQEYVQTSEPGAEGVDYAGAQDYPEWRANATLSYYVSDWSAAWSAYYVGKQDNGFDIWGADYLANVPSYTKHNVQVSYSHPWNGKLTVGVNNVFDKEAPTWYDGFVDYRDVAHTLYDVTGRTVFFKIEQRF